MTMRIRQIKPSFFKDPLVAELAPAVRVFYIGTWLLADDAGWFVWDAAEVGNELYGYERRAPREARVTGYLDELVVKGRLTRHPCGHVFIPKFTEHQRLAGLTKQVRTIAKEHEKCVAPPSPATPRDDPQSPDTVRNGKERVGNGEGTERNGKERVDARETPKDDETESDFRTRTGLPAFLEVVR